MKNGIHVNYMNAAQNIQDNTLSRPITHGEAIAARTDERLCFKVQKENWVVKNRSSKNSQNNEIRILI